VRPQAIILRIPEINAPLERLSEDLPLRTSLFKALLFLFCLCTGPGQAAWAKTLPQARALTGTAAAAALSATADAAMGLSGAAKALPLQATPIRDLAKVAAALGAEEAVVREAYAWNLAERLTYTLIRLSALCSCPVSQLMEERKTRSWGELSGLHGMDWGRLMDELDQRVEAAGLGFAAPSVEQEKRGGANDPASLSAKAAGER
jgi:hypothetical protein